MSSKTEGEASPKVVESKINGATSADKEEEEEDKEVSTAFYLSTRVVYLL